MPFPTRLTPRRLRKASYAIIIALTMTVLLGFAALAIDVSYLNTILIETKNATDASTHAAMVELRRWRNWTRAEQTADAVFGMNPVIGTSMTFADATWEPCLWDFQANMCDPAAGLYNAARLTVHRSADAGTGVNYFFAPILGTAAADLAVSSVAAIRTWEVMIVMDVSTRMAALMGTGVATCYPCDSTRYFVDVMRKGPFDKIGMVATAAWAGNVASPTPMTPLTTLSSSAVVSTVKNTFKRPGAGRLTWCNCGPTVGCPSHAGVSTAWMPPCNAPPMPPNQNIDQGINHGAGIQVAIDQLLTRGSEEAAQAIVVITNDKPWGPNAGVTAAWETATIQAANQAEGFDIDVHVIYIKETAAPAAIGDWLQDNVVRNNGVFLEVANTPATLMTSLYSAMDYLSTQAPICIVE